MDAFLGDSNKDARIGGGDSFTDRLSCRYTVVLFVTFAAVLSATQFVGEPIACWCPSHFTNAHVDYANKLCWVNNTYYLNFSHRIPLKGADKEKHILENSIGYYQWVAVVLICQAFMFYLPRPIWILLNKKSGIAITTLTDSAIECQKEVDPESRKKKITAIVKHMARFAQDETRKTEIAEKGKSCYYKFKLYGSYLVWTYLFVKVIYIANIIGQIFFLTAFLETDYPFYGFSVLLRLLSGNEWQTSKRFPRITFCDFYIRVVGNVQRYTIQCALPLNLFHEIVYVLLWLWLAIVFIFTVVSLLRWSLWCGIVNWQIDYVKFNLFGIGTMGPEEAEKLEYFATKYLQRDGCFILYMISNNTSDTIAAEILWDVWEVFKKVTKKNLDELELTQQEVEALEEYVYEVSSDTSSAITAKDYDGENNVSPIGSTLEIRDVKIRTRVEFSE